MLDKRSSGSSAAVWNVDQTHKLSTLSYLEVKALPQSHTLPSQDKAMSKSVSIFNLFSYLKIFFISLSTVFSSRSVKFLIASIYVMTQVIT